MTGANAMMWIIFYFNNDSVPYSVFYRLDTHKPKVFYTEYNIVETYRYVPTYYFLWALSPR
jgi:hypothetical protein